MKDCHCNDCGKNFKKGDEGDNENTCLRCEAVFMAQVNDDIESGRFDHEE